MRTHTEPVAQVNICKRTTYPGFTETFLHRHNVKGGETEAKAHQTKLTLGCHGSGKALSISASATFVGTTLAKSSTIAKTGFVGGMLTPILGALGGFLSLWDLSKVRGRHANGHYRQSGL